MGSTLTGIMLPAASLLQSAAGEAHWDKVDGVLQRNARWAADGREPWRSCLGCDDGDRTSVVESGCSHE